MQSHSYLTISSQLFPFVNTYKAAHMNIIFDLNGVLFGTQTTESCSSQNRFACALRPVKPAISMRLLSDCARNGHRLFVISNLTSESFEFLKADPQNAHLFSYFEDIILSDMVGIKKPNPGIFHYLLEKHQLEPQDSVFIDDQIINLEAAEQAGITKGILCDNFNFASIRNQLETHGAL